MRRLFLVLVPVVASACGSVDSNKQVDAKVADATGGGSDAPMIDAATCAATPAMLRARYRGENNTNDHAGNFNGTALGTNFTYAAGKYGSAFQLDGVDDTVTINDGDQMWPPGSFTLEAWVKTTATTAGNVISKYACGGQCPQANMSLAYFALSVGASGHPQFDFRPDGTQNINTIAASTLAVNDGNWHHLVGVRDSTAMTATLYVDGAVAASATPAAAEFGAMTNVDNEVDLVTIGAGAVGGQTNAYTTYFTGAVDEVAIYHSALTAAQVSAIYSAPQGKCL